ncbi:MAG TPA: hypothetical protein VKB68_00550 [Stellaceae bacterium]|nr:hypothetical protein [Stellaceae bacterium]
MNDTDDKPTEGTAAATEPTAPSPMPSDQPPADSAEEKPEIAAVEAAVDEPAPPAPEPGDTQPSEGESDKPSADAPADTA